MVYRAFFQRFSLFSTKLRTSIREMSEMTPLPMISLHFDLNEAAKCVDTPPTLLASLSHNLTDTKWRQHLA